MRLIYILFFFFLFSCVNIKKEYVCGDRPCLDKKDFNEYFSQELTVEIMPQKNKKFKNNNLIILNTKNNNVKKIDKKSSKQEDKLQKKAEKQRLKAQKKQLMKERKIKKAELKLKKKKEKYLIRTQKTKDVFKNIIIDKKEIQNYQTKKSVDKTAAKKSNIKRIEKDNIQIDLVKSKNVKSVCDGIKDCDIDKIAEILIKEGKRKPFPNIGSN